MSFIIRDADVVVNGNDLSTNVQAVGVEMTAAAIDLTPVGSRGRVLTQGVLDGVFTVRFLQNITAVHQILQPLLSTATSFPVDISIPGSPVFSMQAEMFRYQPITGVVGEVAGLDVEFVGTITILDNNATITGVRAQATAAGQSGAGTGGDGAYGSGVYGAGRYGATLLLTVTGVRAAASAAGRPGATGIMPIFGVRATATTTVHLGAIGIMPIPGVRASAAASSAQSGGDGMLTAWDGPVV